MPTSINQTLRNLLLKINHGHLQFFATFFFSNVFFDTLVTYFLPGTLKTLKNGFLLWSYYFYISYKFIKNPLFLWYRYNGLIVCFVVSHATTSGLLRLFFVHYCWFDGSTANLVQVFVRFGWWRVDDNNAAVVILLLLLYKLFSISEKSEESHLFPCQ